MKFVKKICSLVLAGLMVFGAVGCGGNTKDSLVITVLHQGYGIKWIEDIVDAFEEKTGKDVIIRDKLGSAGQEAIETEISSTVKGTDIFITEKDSFFKTVYSGSITVDGVKYDNYYAKLTDVYNAELEGENGATIKSKMDKGYLNLNDVNGDYYSLPWQNGILGIVLNMDLWEALGYDLDELPRTTDEMFEICDAIVSKSKSNDDFKNVAPFIYSAESEYYSSFVHMWMAQYEGEESFGWFLDGKDFDGEISEYVYSFKGQEKALDVLDKLLDKDSGYQRSNSDSVDFSRMQAYFLSDQACFCVNGAWLDIEMENYKDKNIMFIPTPVISSVTERFDASSDKTDAKLRDIIDYVDGKTQVKPSGVTDGDIEIVREARNMKYKRGGCGQVFVPSFSEKIDLAKEFLKFMYSDEGLNIYYNTMNGATMPLALSTGNYAEMSNMTTFRENIKNILESESDCFVNMNLVTKAKIYSIGGISINFNNGSLGLAPYYLRNKEKTVKQIIDANQQYVSDNWTKISNAISSH